MSTTYTLTYSDKFKGFPSFYSYIPDFMIGMNNYFYTFNKGDLYRHNSNNVNRNVFYGETNTLPNDPYKGAKSRIKSVFNDGPLDSKIFKTINLESSFATADDAWGGVFDTDVQTTGFIDASFFEKKEGAWFAYIRTENNTPILSSDYSLRSMTGIGNCTTVVTASNPYTINFAVTTEIGSSLSIGDQIYATSTPVLIGTVTALNINLPAGNNSMTVSIDPSSPPVLNNGDFILFAKNQNAESYGVLGHFCEFTLTNTATTPVELFAVETEIMKSFP